MESGFITGTLTCEILRDNDSRWGEGGRDGGLILILFMVYMRY